VFPLFAGCFNTANCVVVIVLGDVIGTLHIGVMGAVVAYLATSAERRYPFREGIFLRLGRIEAVKIVVMFIGELHEDMAQTAFIDVRGKRRQFRV